MLACTSLSSSAAAAGGCTPGPLTEEVVIATRNKYMMEVLRPEEAKHCRQLSFDKETGAPLADCLLEIDRPAFLQGREVPWLGVKQGVGRDKHLLV